MYIHIYLYIQRSFSKSDRSLIIRGSDSRGARLCFKLVEPGTGFSKILSSQRSLRHEIRMLILLYKHASINKPERFQAWSQYTDTSNYVRSVLIVCTWIFVLTGSCDASSGSRLVEERAQPDSRFGASLEQAFQRVFDRAREICPASEPPAWQEAGQGGSDSRGARSCSKLVEPGTGFSKSLCTQRGFRHEIRMLILLYKYALIYRAESFQAWSKHASICLFILCGGSRELI